MTDAKYGRMEVGRCIQSAYQVGCYDDVITEADDRCSGRKRCSIDVPDQALHEITLERCSTDKGIVGYLQAAYTCLPGQFDHVKYS